MGSEWRFSLKCIWVLICLGVWKHEPKLRAGLKSRARRVAVFQELWTSVAVAYHIQEIMGREITGLLKMASPMHLSLVSNSSLQPS